MERLYTDRLPGNAARRPGLDRALEALSPGDTLVCWRLDRLGRSGVQLLQLAAELRRRDVELRSLTEGIDTRTPAGEAYFPIMAAMAQMERRLNSERTKAGIAVAQRRGRRWGRTNFFDSQANVRAANSLLREGSLAKVDIAKRLGISADTLYRRFPGGRPDPPPGAGGGRRVKLAVAQEAFLEDLRVRALRQSTLDGYLAVFWMWLAKAEAEDKAELEDWDAAALRAWRNGWACSPGTHGVRLAKLKAFFRFAVDEGWLAASPAKQLRPPRNDARPTLPLTLAEMRAPVLAARSVSGSVRAFVLLRRYSGLAIPDAPRWPASGLKAPCSRCAGASPGNWSRWTSPTSWSRPSRPCPAKAGTTSGPASRSR